MYQTIVESIINHGIIVWEAVCNNHFEQLSNSETDNENYNGKNNLLFSHRVVFWKVDYLIQNNDTLKVMYKANIQTKITHHIGTTSTTFNKYTSQKTIKITQHIHVDPKLSDWT